MRNQYEIHQWEIFEKMKKCERKEVVESASTFCTCYGTVLATC